MKDLALLPNYGLERIVRFLDWVSSKRAKQPSVAPHLAVGVAGEEAAFFYLRRHGYVIVAERWSHPPLPGDIDLIAWHDDVLCFIEVKTRTSHAVASASFAVDRPKRETLRRLARRYLQQLPGSHDVETRPETRFDIVAIYDVPDNALDINLIPGAFGWSERRDVDTMPVQTANDIRAGLPDSNWNGRAG